MKKKLLLLFACMCTLLANAQLKLYESSFNGGVVGGGYSVGATFPSGTGSFNVTIPGGSTIRRAYLIAGRCGAAPDVTVTLNGTPYTFNASNLVTTGWSTIYGGISAVHAIDVTAGISPATSAYTIATPTQNTVSDKYPEFYLWIAFNNPGLPAVTAAVYANNTNLNVNSYPWTLTTATPVTNANPVGLAILGGYATFSPDCEQVIVNGTNVGSFGGQDWNASSQWGCMAGFQYYNNVLTGYNDDNANQAVAGTDALSNIQAVIPAATSSIPVTFTHCGGGSDNHVWALFLTWAGGVVLDGNLQGFEAEPREESISLSWAISDQGHVAAYELQRSLDGHNFSTLASVSPESGRLAYQWLDLHPNVGSNWYRLRLVDSEGLAQFSETREVLWQQGGVVASQVGPNPLPQGQSLQVMLANPIAFSWEIYGLADGRRLLTGDEAEATLVALPTQQLPSGAYGLRLRAASQSHSIRFVVK